MERRDWEVLRSCVYQKRPVFITALLWQRNLHYEYFFPKRCSQVHMLQTYSSMAQKSLIDFCIVSSDLFSEMLDVQVKRGAELSSDHHLIVLLSAIFETLAK